MTTDQTWETHPVTPDRFDDFADVINPNRRADSCWCLSHRLRAQDIRELGGDGPHQREQAMRALRPSVLVLDVDLTHHEGICSLPALRRASPETAIVLPPAGDRGPRLVRAVRIAARDSERRRENDGLTGRERRQREAAGRATASASR